MDHQRYVVQKGDCLWNLSKRFLGSPWNWRNIFTHNNRPEIVRLTGRNITDPDLIYVGQVLYIPILPNIKHKISKLQKNQPQIKKIPINKPYKKELPVPNQTQKTDHKTHSKTKLQEDPPPPKLKEQMKSKMKVGFFYRLDDLPIRNYEDMAVKATIKFSGKVVLTRPNAVPVYHVTNKGMETTIARQSEKMLKELFSDETKIMFDKESGKITYRNLIVQKSGAANGPCTAMGLAISSSSGTPVMRGEIRFPKLKGTHKTFCYYAEDVRIVIELEPKPKVPPATPGPETVARPIEARKNLPSNPQPKGLSGWEMIGIGGLVLTASILTDFLLVGVADDWITIPAAVAMIARGGARMIFPVLRSAAAYSAAGSAAAYGARRSTK